MSPSIADFPAMLAPQAPVVRKTPTKTAQGLAQGTRVMTVDGLIPVEFLNQGDRVITRSGMRRLARIDIVDYVAAQGCHISASVLGHDRPASDITVGPATPVYIRDWRANALYGRNEVLVQAGRLADGEFIAVDPVPVSRRFFSLVFDRQEVFYAEGLEIASAT